MSKKDKFQFVFFFITFLYGGFMCAESGTGAFEDLESFSNFLITVLSAWNVFMLVNVNRKYFETLGE